MKKINSKNVFDRFHPPAPFAADTWQESAQELIDHAQRALWSPAGARALAWLRDKQGLSDSTIKRARLGYHPGSPTMPRGIVIPGIAGGVIWQVSIRRPVNAPDYYPIPGSRPMLAGADSLAGAEIILITACYLDMLAAAQAIGDVCGVCSFSGGLPDLGAWGQYLITARLFLAACELPRSVKNKLMLIPRQMAKVHSLTPPADSLAAYQAGGGDLWGWLGPHLERLDPATTWQAWAVSVGADFFEVQTSYAI